MVGALPGTELVRCPGAGHMLMLERPDEVNGALVGVVRRVAGRGRARGGRRAGRRPPVRGRGRASTGRPAAACS
ncbi:hypothetical protein GCM10027605_54210 [Micromonospora zhanjiangensis]